MSSKKLFFVLAGVIGLLFVALVGGAYGVNSLLSSRATSLTAAKATDQALEQQKLILKKAKKDIAKYTQLEKITKEIVPEDKSQAEAVSELVRIAAKNGVSLSSITFPASSLGGGAVAPTGVTTNPSSGASKKSLSQLQAVKNIPGVYQLQIVVTSDTNKPVPYEKFISFLDDLEHNRRTAQVSSISIQPDPLNRKNLTFGLTLNEYIKP